MNKQPRDSSWYDTREWRTRRLNRLAKQPLCEQCLKLGIEKGAKVADHIKPHRGNWELFIDDENLQSLCWSCHNSNKQMIDIHGYSQACDVNGFPLDKEHPFNKRG